MLCDALMYVFCFSCCRSQGVWGTMRYEYYVVEIMLQKRETGDLHPQFLRDG